MDDLFNMPFEFKQYSWVDTSKTRFLLESLRLEYFLKHYRQIQTKLCLSYRAAFNVNVELQKGGQSSTSS